MDTVGSHPERIRNLNFAFVVLLRALRKAAPVLASFSYAVSGDSAEDLRTAALVRRLLESHLMSSCSQVFDSFDETLMFQNRTSEVKKAFKSAFISISKTLDCIRCQKCRLHGKMQLTGIGLALKILLLSDDVIKNTPVHRIARREEIVALFNTVFKFSHAINSVDFLTELHLSQENPPIQAFPSASESGSPEGAVTQQEIQPVLDRSTEDLARAIESIARAYFAGALKGSEEKALLDIAVSRGNSQARDVLFALSRGYGATDPTRFASHALRMVFAASPGESIVEAQDSTVRKIIVVVGSGLAGSSAALTLLDAIGSRLDAPHVLFLEKQNFLGGNSVYASSGMNAVDEKARRLGDSFEAFAQDMAKSSGKGDAFAFDPMVAALTGDSEDALHWVRERVGVDFSQLGKLGGHSFARTHRPERGQAGAELVFAIHKLLKGFADAGRLTIAKGERLLGMRREPQTGLLEVKTDKQTLADVSAVILATGGFAANKSLLPGALRPFGTTNGPFTTGDAVYALRELGAEFRDMDKVQLHPTAFSSDDKSAQQPLCAEILRGVGGILLNSKCQRFADELGTRAYVSNRMVASKEKDFVLLLSAEQAKQAEHFRSTYLKRGLLVEVDSTADVARFAGCDESVLRTTLNEYAKNGREGLDGFGKKSFPSAETLVSTRVYYAGRVQPAVHYCMGGVATDAWGRVLASQSRTLPRVYAAGEVSGGLHGENRLGGNGMTEGLVFGRRAARAVLKDILGLDAPMAKPLGMGDLTHAKKPSGKLQLTVGELAKHRTPGDCWVAIRGKVYDFSSFLNEHPGGSKAILDVAGKDGTELYEEIHTAAFLEDFTPIGELV
jgi:flavocytochrome c